MGKPMKRKQDWRKAAALALVLGTAACHREETRRLTALEADLAALRTQLESVASRPAPTPLANDQPAKEDTAPPAPQQDERGQLEARAAVTRSLVKQTSELLGVVDEDLAYLEDHVDGHMDRIDTLASTVGHLSAAVNNHADAMDALADDVDQIRRDAELMRELSQVIRVENGNIVIDQADLILRHGFRDDGLPDSKGRIYTQVTPDGG